MSGRTGTRTGSRLPARTDRRVVPFPSARVRPATLPADDLSDAAGPGRNGHVVALVALVVVLNLTGLVMVLSASAAASAVVRTRSPSSSALARDFDPSGSPMRTSTPESRRLSACAWPWLPYPITATLRPWMIPRSASAS